MVHGMDALSKKWRDDPVRAALEKKSSRDAAAERIAQANAIAGDILKKRLESQGSSHAGSSSRRFDEEEGAAAGMSDADYRLALERQRKKLMDGDQSDSSSSNISVFDPFQSKHDRRAEKAERKDKDRKRDKDKKEHKREKHNKHKHKHKHHRSSHRHKHHDKDKKRRRHSRSVSDGSEEADEDEERHRKYKRQRHREREDEESRSRGRRESEER